MAIANAKTVAPLFLAHGAPTLAISDTPAHRFLREYGRNQPRPKGVVILSAHWETRGLRVSAPGPLRTIYDFHGFPRSLHDISYPAEATDELVRDVMDCLASGGHEPQTDAGWGLDHGAWVPLSLVYPEPDFPVVAVSLPFGCTPGGAFSIGRSLAPLASAGLQVIGSGSTVHNLREISRPGSDAPDWAVRFDRWLDDGLRSGSIDYFADLERAPEFRRNHPTEEHLLPVFFAFGAAGPKAMPELLHRSYDYGSISMSYYRFGCPEAAPSGLTGSAPPQSVQ